MTGPLHRIHLAPCLSLMAAPRRWVRARMATEDGKVALLGGQPEGVAEVVPAIMGLQAMLNTMKV